MSLSPSPSEENQNNSSNCEDDQSSVASSQDSPQAKRLCMRDEPSLPYMDLNNVMRYALQPSMNDMISPAFFPQLAQQHMSMFMPSLPGYMEPLPAQRLPYHPQPVTDYYEETSSQISSTHEEQNAELFVDVVSTSSEESQESPKFLSATVSPTSSPNHSVCEVPVKRSSFSISSILGSNTRNAVSV